MKVGKPVWVKLGKKIIEAKLVTFGKGPDAEIELQNGKLQLVPKSSLLPKNPCPVGDP